MTNQEKIKQAYTVQVRQPADAADEYHIVYAPRGVFAAEANGSSGPFEAVTHVHGEDVTIRWVHAPSGGWLTLENLGLDARDRARTLHDWMVRLWPLVRSVKAWGEELGWATRLIEKKLEDSRIGKYQAPALLMQEGTDRILLEPVGRSAPGTEGVVDLYLMPAYDDIATLYFYDGRWNLHFATGTDPVDTVRDVPSKPISKETLQEVLQEMRRNGA